MGMDYLYAQLPDEVYDPVDLTGVSSTGTIRLNIDNNKRIIDANVIRVPNALTIIDNNKSETYTYDGSSAQTIEIPQVKNSLTLEYKLASQADIDNNIPTTSAKVGDAYIQVTQVSGDISYIPLETGNSGGIIQLTSLQIFASLDAIPMSASYIGATYIVRNNDSPSGLAVYERQVKTTIGTIIETEWALIDQVRSHDTFVDLNTGLLAVGVEEITTGRLKVLRTALDQKQDLLAFSDSYNAYNNKVIVHSTLKAEAEALEARIASLKAEHDIELQKLHDNDLATNKAIADLDTKYLTEVEKLVASDQASAEDLADLKTTYESKVATLEKADDDNKQTIATVTTKIKSIEDNLVLLNNRQIKDLKYTFDESTNSYTLIHALEDGTTQTVNIFTNIDNGELK